MRKTCVGVVKVSTWMVKMLKNAKTLLGSEVALLRDTDATLIPSGQPLLLEKDTKVIVTQALGSSITIQVNGNLVLIHEEDVGALGVEPDMTYLDCAKDVSMDMEKRAWTLLKTCYDPEIPVNIVDLGLIYGCQFVDEDIGQVAYVAMTLTAPGCGMGPILVENVRRKVMLIPEVKRVEVEMVFDPPWSQDRMSDEAKLQLKLL